MLTTYILATYLAGCYTSEKTVWLSTALDWTPGQVSVWKSIHDLITELEV